VAQALRSTDLGERRAAASRLLELPPEVAKPLVATALLDPDEQVRLMAARTAGELRMRGVGATVVSWLNDPDPRLRVAACGLIDPEPSAEVVAALGRVLGDAVPEVRRAAASALGAADSSDAVAPLLGRLDDSVVAVRLEVVRALDHIGDARAVLPLVSKLQDGDADLRAAAARALGALGDHQAIPTLMLALQDPADNVRVEALHALGALRAEAAVSAIAALLSVAEPSAPEAGSPQTRAAALGALGRIGTAQALRLLLVELEREGASSAARPLDRLGPAALAFELGGDGARALLLETLRTTASSDLATGAALTLAHLHVTEAGPVVLRAAQRGTLGLRGAVAALGALGDATVIPRLLEHLDAPDPSVRRDVVAVVARLLDPKRPDGRVVDPVRPRLLDDRTPLAERIALIELLGRTGAARAQQLLLGLGQSDVPELRLAVVRAPGELGLGSKEVDTLLLEALSSSSAKLRMAAAQSLGRVGRDETVAQLLDQLEHAAEQDRGAIGLALSGALAQCQNAALLERVERALAVASEHARDALLEGLGRSSHPVAGQALRRQASSPSSADRRKVAEALAGHPAEAGALLALSRDSDPSVRANAVWSLGELGHVPALERFVALLGDLDVNVAANAAAAIGRVARTGGDGARTVAALCAALDDSRSYVRANTLVALRALGARCPNDTPRLALQADRSWRVRLAAAEWAWQAGDAGAASGNEKTVATKARRALARCAREDRDAAVAARCATAPTWPTERDSVLVYVVPYGATTPVPHAAYALELGNGSLRLGTADRRGALFERAAPRGAVRLGEPGALAP
jgi:HEAT repeat protein